MITLKDLNEYTLLKKEVADLKKRINQHESIVSDVVTGSSLEHPYTKHAISIYGVDCSYSNNQYSDYLYKINLLQLKISEIEDWLSKIDDSLARLIIRYKYFDGLGWRRVATKVGGGHTESSIKQYFFRFMWSQSKHNV